MIFFFFRLVITMETLSYLVICLLIFMPWQQKFTDQSWWLVLASVYWSVVNQGQVTLWIMHLGWDVCIRHNFTTRGLKASVHNTKQISYNEMYVSAEKTTTNKYLCHIIDMNRIVFIMQKSDPISSVSKTLRQIGQITASFRWQHYCYL